MHAPITVKAPTGERAPCGPALVWLFRNMMSRNARKTGHTSAPALSEVIVGNFIDLEKRAAPHIAVFEGVDEGARDRNHAQELHQAGVCR